MHPFRRPAAAREPGGADYTATLPRKRMGAGLVFGDDAGRVLLVEPTYKPYWEFPGGAVEAGESPRAAVEREVAEELGLAGAVPGRLLVVDWVPPAPQRTEGLMLLFDGGRLDPQRAARIVLPPDELRGWAWCTPAEAGRRLSDLLARRLSAALAARDHGGPAYLEDGHPVG